MMKNNLQPLIATICALALLCIVAPAHAQKVDKYYEAAYSEMADMLDGKAPLSVKRAVFLDEWAFLDGKLDYTSYSAEIDSTANAIKRFYTANGFDQFKTGLNVTLFEYFSRPYSMNGYQPFTYDYEDFAGSEDYTKLFVTKVMRTHSGQCHSLPMYYKILAEAIGAEAYITFAPQHQFIRHRDEQDPTKWVNVELTTQSLSREIFYIERFGITDEAIRNKVYLYPLTDRETVAFQLACLAASYSHKYKKDDSFTLRCAEKSLEYYPQGTLALQLKMNAVNAQMIDRFTENNEQMDDHAYELNEQWLALEAQLKGLGWGDIPDDVYEGILKGVEESMVDKGVDTITIQRELNKQRELDKKPKPASN